MTSSPLSCPQDGFLRSLPDSAGSAGGLRRMLRKRQDRKENPWLRPYHLAVRDAQTALRMAARVKRQSCL